MYFRLAIRGTLPSGEVWSINPVFDPEGEIVLSWDQATGDAMVAALIAAITSTTLPAPIKSALSSNVNITGYRLEGRDEAERLVGVSEAAYATPLSGGGSLGLPLPTSATISLRTNTPGARGRGRLYLPFLVASGAVGTNGRIPAATRDALGGAMRTLLGLIESTLTSTAGLGPGESLKLAVRSVTSHQSHIVNRIQVGDVPDTQRRRRDALAESYWTAAYPAP